MVSLSTSALLSLLPVLALGSPMPIQNTKRYTGQVIQSFRTGTCLTLPAGTAPADGALLTVGDCSTATLWDISPGSGSVVVSGTNFALDAGVNPHNNVPAKVWTSYPGATQQTWFLTGDNRIAITGGNQCLDEGDNGPQTYQCTTGNTNQVWMVMNPPSGPTSSSSSSASMTATPTSSSSSSTASPTSTPSCLGASHLTSRRQLLFSGGQGCVTVQGGTAYNGVPLVISSCQFPDDNGSNPQQFNYLPNGQIQSYLDPNYCVDAGSNPASGTGMKLWQCYDGLPQQTWNIGSGCGLFSTANNQCLDVQAADMTTVQTWTCSASDPQQQFTII